jgi:hypothetical protein
MGIEKVRMKMERWKKGSFNEKMRYWRKLLPHERKRGKRNLE